VWFAAWFAIGGGAVLAVLALLSFGVFLLPVVLLAAVLTALRPAARRGISGLIAGAGVPALYIAFLNRYGPGEHCRSTGPGGTDCIEMWSPWPWALVGLLLVAVGVVVMAVRPRR
jgi:uncharacterized membrane protein YwaF